MLSVFQAQKAAEAQKEASFASFKDFHNMFQCGSRVGQDGQVHVLYRVYRNLGGQQAGGRGGSDTCLKLREEDVNTPCVTASSACASTCSSLHLASVNFGQCVLGEAAKLAARAETTAAAAADVETIQESQFCFLQSFRACTSVQVTLVPDML